MNDLLPLLTLIAALTAALVAIALLLRRPPDTTGDTEKLRAALTDELRRLEQALRADLTAQRGELMGALETSRAAQDRRLDAFAASLTQLQQHLAEALSANRDSLAEALTKNRLELTEAHDKSREQNAAAASETRRILDARLAELAQQNEIKLEQMRQTVDEKLQSTLEKRLGESFKFVGDNLEKVIHSLGEMQAVASDVGDLKRVLTNVKTRGTWGEMQLASLLESILSPGQYEANVKPIPRRDAIVEFAVRLPGRDDGEVRPVWLPIDSKFPREDYERLVIAAERADADAVEQSTKALAACIESAARDIRNKYVSPPHTTDFAILFLPTEGLYAEVLRIPGLTDKVQRNIRVLIAGPTTLAALLNSLQMGFRTLAVQKRSAEVEKLLGAIKTQFGTFGELLSNVQKKLESAGNEVGKAADRHRIITKKMNKLEALPAAEAERLLSESQPASTSFIDDDAPADEVA